MITITLFRWIRTATFCLAFPVAALAQPIPPRLYSVEASASVQTSPPRVTLSWPADPNATAYFISRRNTAGWVQAASLPGAATQFVDASAALGSRTEYEILKTTARGYNGSGYVLAGINAPAIEARGTVILLVDATWSTRLATELRRLEQDLTGDGWSVLRQDVPRSASVAQVKAIIQSLYSSDPQNIRALFLFGHLAVPYSGDFTADSHANHRGAWPADAFYGDMDGTWTDSSVTSLNAEKAWNHNVPGDGKFDQSELPSAVELEVGRVDLHNMTCFANKAWSRDEEFLLRQYLEKDHRFRHGQLPVPRRGLIIDNFGADVEALASTGWRAFAPMFGAQNSTQISWGTFFPTLNGSGYLWAYGNGGGSYYTCAGIGSSDDFALNDIRAVFTFFFGSYYGDWDNESNFLRAPLGSTTYTLTSTWGSRPHWFVHHMALGETIGFSTRLTQNNTDDYAPLNFGAGQVHTALHGDPTLRMHPVIPPSNFSASAGSGVTLTWTPSPDNVVGYYVYRGSSEMGPFTRITANHITGTTFQDSGGTLSSVYMLRALKLESSASGTYFNLSQGLFVRVANPPAAPTNLSGSHSSSGNSLTWADNSSDEQGFRIYRKTTGNFTLIASTGANIQSYSDAVPPSGNNTYAVASFNSAGESIWSNHAIVIPPGTASATVVGTDTMTRGSWKGVYGSQGYNVIQNAQNYPSYVSLTASGNSSWTWNSNTADPAALNRVADNSRLAACWYSAASFEIQLSFADSALHRLTLYFLDWDRLGRRQVLDVLHRDTGALLASRTIENFQNGVHLTLDLQGRVTLRLRALTGNAVLSGFFFDPAVATVSTPVFNPAGGIFTNNISVSISSGTAGAAIRYTTNNVDPTPGSPLYSGPIAIGATTTIKARAFKADMADSTVAAATYTITAPPDPESVSVTFHGPNTTRGGTWKGNLGAQGHLVVADSQSLPSYVSIAPSGKADWTWAYSTTDTRALQRQSLNSRVASCWYASAAFDVELNFSDTQPHRVSFYCVDWDRANRQQRIEVLDFTTRQVLHSYTLSNFSNGTYLDYSIKGRVIVRFTRITSFNAVMSGIFFDAN